MLFYGFVLFGSLEPRLGRTPETGLLLVPLLLAGLVFKLDLDGLGLD